MLEKKFLLVPSIWQAAKEHAEAGEEIAVWQNQDLGHPGLGHVVLCFVGPTRTYKTASDVPKTMPDGSAGIFPGWRYILQGVFTSDQFSETFILDGTPPEAIKGDEEDDEEEEEIEEEAFDYISDHDPLDSFEEEDDGDVVEALIENSKRPPEKGEDPSQGELDLPN